MVHNITGFHTPQSPTLPSVTRVGGAPEGGARPVNVQNGPGFVPANPESAGTEATFEQRQMGGLTYSRETAPLPWSSLGNLPLRLQCLLGDGTDVVFHRVVGIPVKLAPNHTYTFSGYDSEKRGQSLVAVKLNDGRREVFEMTFNDRVLKHLAMQVRTDL